MKGCFGGAAWSRQRRAGRRDLTSSGCRGLACMRRGPVAWTKVGCGGRSIISAFRLRRCGTKHYAQGGGLCGLVWFLCRARGGAGGEVGGVGRDRRPQGGGGGGIDLRLVAAA